MRQEAAARQEVAAAVASSVGSGGSGADDNSKNLSEQRRLLAELNAKVDEAKKAIDRQKKENAMHQAVVNSLAAAPSTGGGAKEAESAAPTQGTSHVDALLLIVWEMIGLGTGSFAANDE